MAQSKPVDERALEVWEKMSKQNEKIIKQNENILRALGHAGEKVSIAEFRQCHRRAQGADAARMTASYFKAESAMSTDSAKMAILEMVYKTGSLKAIEYQCIFNEKDERRRELAFALFWKTY